MNTMILTQSVFLAEDESLVGRVFGLDAQLLMDSLIVACAMLFLFTLLSYLVFNPARELLKKRRDKMMEDLEAAAKDKEEGAAFKAEYLKKLHDARQDAEAIIAEGRRKAAARGEEIVGDAKKEAERILARTEKEAALEKEKVKDEVRKEMVDVASEIAGKFISEKMDDATRDRLAREVIDGMGETTWQ